MVFRNHHICLCSLLPLISGVSCPLLFKTIWLALPHRRKTCKARQLGWLSERVKRWAEEQWKELRGGGLKRWL